MTSTNPIKFMNDTYIDNDLIVAGSVNTRNIQTDGTNLDNHIADVSSNPHNVSLNQITPTTTKGDLIVADNPSSLVRLPVGANDTFLVSDSGVTEGLKWTSTIPSISIGTISSQTTNQDILLSPSGTGEVLLTKDPVTNLAVATKQYVDNLVTGLTIKAPVKIKTTSALPTYTQSGTGAGATLTATANGQFPIIDDIQLNLNDRILVDTDGTTSDSHNGIYILSQSGDGSNPWILTRAADLDSDEEAKTGVYTFIEEGTAFAGDSYVITTDNPITIDSTPITFTKFYGAVDTTITNIGTSGIPIFKQKTGPLLELKKITTPSSHISLIDDIPNDTVSIDLNNTVVTTTDTQTLTNKTITASSNTIEASQLRSASSSINIALATQPTSGQVLTATSGSSAEWQTPTAEGTTTSHKYFNAYISGAQMIYTLWTPINWTNEIIKDTEFTHAANSSQITFNETDNYIVHVDISVENTIGSSSRTSVESRIQLDTGSGFTELSGTRTIHYIRQRNYGQTSSITRYVQINSGDILRVQAMRTIGNATTRTQPDGCRILISRA